MNPRDRAGLTFLSFCAVLLLGLLCTYMPRWGLLAGQWHSFPSPWSGAGIAERLGAMLWRWDALHYRAIAEQGYRATSEELAFFPGWPLVLRALRALPLPWTLSIVIWNFGMALLAANCWGELFARARSPGAVRGLIFFPTAVFFVAPYPEITFIAVTGFAFCALLKRHAWRFALCLAALVLLKHVGVAVAAALIVAAATAYHSPRLTLFGAIAAALSFSGVLFFYRHISGDPWAWLHAQQTFWHRSLATPVHFVADLYGKPVDWAVYVALALLAPPFLLFKAGAGRVLNLAERRLHLAFFLLCAAVLFPVIFGSSVQSIYRICALATPTLLVGAALGSRLPRLLQYFATGLWVILFISSTYKFCAGLHLP